MIYEEIMEYMPISGQNAVPDCVWTSSPNSFLHHAWNHALNTSTSNHQADRIVFGLPLCSSHTHCPSCQGVAGTDCPGMSLQHPHHRPKNGPDYSGPGEAQSQCCQGEFGWCMRRSVFLSEETSNSYWSDKKPRGHMMKWSADQDKHTEGYFIRSRWRWIIQLTSPCGAVGEIAQSLAWVRFEILAFISKELRPIGAMQSGQWMMYCVPHKNSSLSNYPNCI